MILKSLVAGLSLFGIGTAYAEVPPENSVQFSSKTSDYILGGTGCPAGTWNVEISSDNQLVSFIFDGYKAEKLSGSLNGDVKSCVIYAMMTIPVGWQYSVVSFEYNGWIKLDQGVTATQVSQYRYVDPPNSVSVQYKNTWNSDARGNLTFDEPFSYTDQIGIISKWSGCSRKAVSKPLEIKTTASISPYSGHPNAGLGAGSLSIDTLDVGVETKQTFKLAWRRC